MDLPLPFRLAAILTAVDPGYWKSGGEVALEEGDSFNKRQRSRQQQNLLECVRLAVPLAKLTSCDAHIQAFPARERVRPQVSVHTGNARRLEDIVACSPIIGRW